MRTRTTVAIVAAGTVLGLALGGTAMAAPSPTQARIRTGAVTVTDIQIPVPGQAPVDAYLVRPVQPARPHSQAGVLFLHWFEPGQSTQNKAEFLAEAVTLAGQGAVAVLPQLTFPWNGDPVGDARDRAAVTAQFEAVRAAYHALLAQNEVDPGRTAVVGHDYGAMYASILAQRERTVHALVFMAGDSTWANWFDTYWLGLPDDQKAAYRALFAGLDPVDNVSRLGAHVYFQFADLDIFVTPPVRAAFAAANPAAKVTVYPGSQHFLTQPAQDDRLAWVRAELRL
jgi:dienelactone hydrolase